LGRVGIRKNNLGVNKINVYYISIRKYFNETPHFTLLTYTNKRSLSKS
jgi:hypothetical protein